MRPPISCPSIVIAPAVRTVEAGEDVHERGLAGPGRTHDGGELAATQVDVGAAQGVDGGVALAVALGDAARRDDDGAARCAGRAAVDVPRRPDRPLGLFRRLRATLTGAKMPGLLLGHDWIHLALPLIVPRGTPAPRGHSRVDEGRLRGGPERGRRPGGVISVVREGHLWPRPAPPRGRGALPLRWTD